MMDTNPRLTKNQVASLVSRYLAGQSWELVEADTETASIWDSLDGEATKPAVLTQLRRRYAATLHHHCRQSDTAASEQAWQELRTYLANFVGRFQNHPAAQQEIIQETLIALRQARPLKKPASFLSFAITTMRHKNIDHHRRQTAEKRDRRSTISLEEVGKSDDEGNDRHWEESFRTSGKNWRTIEDIVSDQEVRQQLLQFAQAHLPTELQQMVFEAHFLNGLKPAEIAPLLDKQPHQIRLVKARIVKKLKSLPPADKEQLQIILGGLENDG